MKKRISRALALLLALAPGAAAMAYEEPDYEVVSEAEGFELRRYPAYLTAETEVRGDFGAAGNEAFRILAAFISGENRSRQEIAMTAPVTNVEGGGEKIAMTAPVTNQPGQGEDASEDGSAWVYRFVMPSQYTRETLPEPTDPRIRIREVPARLVAARRFRGFWREKNFRDNEVALRAALADADLEPAGPAVYARYDPPFMPWFLRRNEIWIEVLPAPAAPEPVGR